MPADALSPMELWQQADAEHPGDDEGRIRRYNELMVEHGHVVPRCNAEQQDPDGLGAPIRCSLAESHEGLHRA